MFKNLLVNTKMIFVNMIDKIFIKMKKEYNIQQIHISFDDVQSEIYKYNDIYIKIEDSSLFGELKRLHNLYNAKFLLYIFYENEESLPESFIKILKNNDWLSINYHGSITTNNTEEKYIQFIDRCKKYNLKISRYTRLHYFKASQKLRKWY